ncbi:DUF4260 domain-containing protein [Flagellimonas allohymeniacidonis]|uniref:DUF4260 family protein n=1 Tax=Flagellimonas allohymeniacidonis TaxID=2517819 RepID=A0A4Q8QA52_9FLAO|nr:DUF4260 domain-containing protein [Allomuricauda hymeniacidonis]TAI47172.1 DUF4260 family protein [Allomuricauda hymeniacidonis]
MKNIIQLEEVLMFILGIYLFSILDYRWFWFLILILTPDIGMLGYLFGNKVGAVLYNIFHHKGLAIALYLLGIYFELPVMQLGGIILFSHSAMDRAMGYGLKYEKGFKFTHLGEIGKKDG